MGFSLDSISKKTTIRAPRMLVLGTEKIGKTTFSCGSQFEDGVLVKTGLNDPIIISIKGEEGSDALDVAKFPTCNSYEDVMSAIGVLYQNEHPYRTVVIDSASALEPLVWEAVCDQHKVNTIEKVGGGYGKGYVEAVSFFRQLADGLDALRMKNVSSIIIGHVKVKRFDDPNGDSYDQYQFDVHDKVANLLYRWADLILFANTKVVVKKEDVGFKKEKKRGIDTTGGQRFLYTQKRPAHPGGGRGIYGRLPYEMDFDWASFENEVAKITAE